MDTIITNKPDEKTANCVDKEVAVKNYVLAGDKEYIEEYFKICELFQKKRSIRPQPRGAGPFLSIPKPGKWYYSKY